MSGYEDDVVGFETEESPEEFQQQVTEWTEFIEEDFVGAIEAGYLDDVLGKINATLQARRATLGVVRRKRSETPTTVTPSGVQVGQEYHTPGVDLPVMGPEYANYVGVYTTRHGESFRKSDIQRCGQRFVLEDATNRQYRGAVLRVVKVNRTKAVCEVIGHEKFGVASNVMGKDVNVPLDMVVKSIRKYNDTYGTN